MKPAFKIPTLKEIRQAGADYREEPRPLPIAQRVDDSELGEMIHIMLGTKQMTAYDLMKSAMVLGIYYGVRIGESRSK